jgi:hypothetical protein
MIREYDHNGRLFAVHVPKSGQVGKIVPNEERLSALQELQKAAQEMGMYNGPLNMPTQEEILLTMKPMTIRYFDTTPDNTESVTIDLPKDVARALHKLCADTKQTLEEALTPPVIEILTRLRYLDANR